MIRESDYHVNILSLLLSAIRAYCMCMSSIPTTSDMAELGSRIAEDGFAAHESTVAEIAALGLEVEPEAPSLHVLADTSAPTPVRVRALVCVGYRWAGIRRQHIERQRQFDQSLAELLDVWNQHQDLRASATEQASSSPSSVTVLADSRSKLDALRWAVARQRAELAA